MIEHIYSLPIEVELEWKDGGVRTSKIDDNRYYKGSNYDSSNPLKYYVPSYHPVGSESQHH